LAASTSNYQPQIIKSNSGQWLNDHTLLYATDFEIWLWDSRHQQAKLLTRVSQKISQVFWHPDNNYIIYSTDQGLYSLELDDRDRHQINQLAEVKNLQQTLLSQDGKIIYFYGQIGQQTGLWQLEI